MQSDRLASGGEGSAGRARRGRSIACIRSKRPSRALAGEAANQTQNVLQTALRLHF